MHFIEPGICKIVSEQYTMLVYTAVRYTNFVLVGYAIFCKTAIILTNWRQLSLMMSSLFRYLRIEFAIWLLFTKGKNVNGRMGCIHTY